MSKSKEKSELEYLRGQNQKLKSENRHLKKQLGYFRKRVTEDDIDYPDEEIPAEAFTPKGGQRCPKCANAIEVIDLAVRIMHICDCGYRKTFKK